MIEKVVTRWLRGEGNDPLGDACAYRTRSRWRRFPDRGHVLGRLRVRVVDVHLENLPCIPPILLHFCFIGLRQRHNVFRHNGCHVIKQARQKVAAHHGRISSTCHFVTMKCLGDHRTALPLAADVNLLSLAVF